jgi:hypothetical protein
MNIFEQLDDAQIMLINGVPTTNFGYCPDDPPEDWCLSVYGYDPETGQNFEHYFDREELEGAERADNKWILRDNPREGYNTKLEFCVLIGVEQYYEYEDRISQY